MHGKLQPPIRSIDQDPVSQKYRQLPVPKQAFLFPLGVSLAIKTLEISGFEIHVILGN